MKKISYKIDRKDTKFFLGFFLLLFLGMCSAAVNNRPKDDTSVVPYHDEKAYDEWKRRGFSDEDAAKAAAPLRRLCETAGGNDCQY